MRKGINHKLLLYNYLKINYLNKINKWGYIIY